jgi:hypothetical protein
MGNPGPEAVHARGVLFGHGEFERGIGGQFEGPEPELEEILTPLQVDRGQRMEGIEVVEVDENR